MPSGPSTQTLEKLAPKIDELLDRPLRLCPEGGRVLGRSRPGCEPEPIAKLGGYMTRRLVHWRKTGVYPAPDQKWIPGDCGDEDCTECGTFGIATERQPEPTPIVTVAPPPPVPARPTGSVELVRAAATVERRPLEGTSRGSRSGPFQVARSIRSTVPGWVWRAALCVAAGMLFVVCVVVVVQVVGLALSNVGGVLPDVDVVVPSTSTLPG